MQNHANCVRSNTLHLRLARAPPPSSIGFLRVLPIPSRVSFPPRLPSHLLPISLSSFPRPASPPLRVFPLTLLRPLPSSFYTSPRLIPPASPTFTSISLSLFFSSLAYERGRERESVCGSIKNVSTIACRSAFVPLFLPRDGIAGWAGPLPPGHKGG